MFNDATICAITVWIVELGNRFEVMTFCRYERSQKQAAFGRSLVQRHVALPNDIANEAGEGLLVSFAPWNHIS